MFSTSLTAAAVASLLATGSLSNQPVWQADYRTAVTLSAQQQKPVAVFLARGGVADLVTDGIGAEAAKLLRQNYVCLVVDTTTDGGKELAGSFGVTEGLVISDKTGELRALQHGGTLTRAALAQYLTRYAGTETVARTEYAGAAAAPVAYDPAAYGQPAPQTGPIRNAIGNMRQFFGGG